MIGLAFYSSTQTTLDLNGPFLRFSSEPDSETVNDGGSVTLTGVATAEFKHNPTTIPGESYKHWSIAYQWYIGGVAAEDVSGKISGSQTNELTLSNLVSPTDNGKTAFLRATYTGSAYQSEEVLLQQASLLQLAMVSINPLTQVKLQSLLIQQ